MKKIFTLFIAIIIVLITNTGFASTVIETVGDIGEVTLPVTAISITLFHEDLTGLSEFAYAYVLSTATVQSLKHSIQRKRPNHKNQSFPSGHTANGFMAASFLQYRYGWAYGAPAYAMAMTVGYSRVQAHKHWVTDVLAGAAIGIGSSFLFTHPYTKKINLSPYLNPNHKEAGISISTTLP